MHLAPHSCSGGSLAAKFKTLQQKFKTPYFSAISHKIDENAAKNYEI
ncbi:conserved domain protein [Roseibium sp. TrichSKD4]|nr:conserved domain protein [Roseibium sp. TrichSKD4]